MRGGSSLRLFEAFGVELEYMIVEQSGLKVRPWADRLLELAAGGRAAEFDAGPVTWSNELVNHVIEFKCSQPVSDLRALQHDFEMQIDYAGRLLEPAGLRLLPTGAHPFMDPARECTLWPDENSDIYQAYNRIFGCRGHGWANLQSVHLNLPFGDDDEFGRLHAAVRLMLPLLPALAAGTPVLDGRPQPWLDARLESYRHNQARIPLVAGSVIPEPAFTREDYHRSILHPMYQAIAPHDPRGILREEWLNSRGAIARFDRQSIEIRIIDIQESPRADMSIVSLIIAALQAMVAQRWESYAYQRKIATEPLVRLLLKTIRDADRAVIDDPGLLACFGVAGPREITAGALWGAIAEAVIAPHSPWREHLKIIFTQGCLARRIIRSLRGDFSRQSILRTYRALARCLSEGCSFEVPGDTDNL